MHYKSEKYWLEIANNIKKSALDQLNYARKIIKCIKDGGHYPYKEFTVNSYLYIRCKQCGVDLDSYTGFISQDQADTFFNHYINEQG